MPTHSSDATSPLDPQGVLTELRARAERRQLVTQSVAADAPLEVQRLVQELQVHQIELEMQYEELVLAQAEAEASRAQYQDLYEFAPVGYCTLLENGTLHQLNLGTAKLLGTVRRQLLGRRLAVFIAPQHRNQFADFVLRLFREDVSHPIIVEMRRPDEQLVYVRMEGLRATTPGHIQQVRLALVDVSEQYRALQALSLSERRFRILFEQSQDGMVLLRDNRFIDCNQAALNLLGLRSKRELLGQHAATLSPERQPGGQLSVGLADTKWQQTLSRGHCRYEWRRHRTDGTEFWEDILQTRIPEAEGNIVHAVWRDITAEKQAAAQLRESEQRLQQALGVSALGVIDWNLDADALYWDERARAMFGYPYEPGPPTSAAVRTRVHPQDQDQLWHLIHQLTPGQPTLESEFRVLLPSGEEAYLSMVGQLVATPPTATRRLLCLVRDVTRHRAADQELNYKNHLLQHMLDHMPVLLARLTTEGKYVELAGAGLRQLNLPGPAMEGYSIFESFPTLDEPIRQLLAGQEVQFLGAAATQDEPVYFQSYGFFDTERDQGVLFGIDVSETERQRRLLQQQQEFTQSLLDSSIDAVIAIGADRRITSWNRQAEQFTGISVEQAVGKQLEEAIPALAEDGEFMGLFTRALAGETVQHLSWSGRYFRGTLDLNLVALLSTGQAAGVLILARDVTQREQLRAETTLLKLREQQVVLSAILTTQEEERRRIAEALHNGVGQLLYAASLHLDQLPNSAPVKSSKQLLRDAVRATRTISFELTPGILEDFGLPAALQELTKRIPAASLRVDMRLIGLEQPLSSLLQTAIYRIVQELLNNVMKHAHATTVEVEVARTPDTVQATVQDNGVGFDATNVEARSGIGLAGIRNRVKLLGGQLCVTSEPGQGTTVCFSAPVPPGKPA